MNEAIQASRAALALSGINRGWMLTLGILLVALGIIGLGMTYALAVAAVFWSGIFAVIAGGGQLLDAFHHKAWRGVAWHIAVGLVYLLLGIMLITMPTLSAFWLTKLIALGLLLNGIMRLVIMFQVRGRRGLQLVLLLSAAVSIGLGIYIYQLVASPGPEVFATAETQAEWVRSWKWVIGLFVAIELITEGVTLISISVSSKVAREE
jgi:uncharacterized membrane protein HdeD (DUF308 family)